MSEERSRILQMLAAGKVSVEEAQQLLETLGNAGDGDAESAGESPGSSLVASGSPAVATAVRRYLRVVIEGPNEHVNVKVPLALFRAGIKLQGLLPNGAAGQVADSLRQSGIDLDALSSKDPQAIEELIAGLSELTVEVKNNQHHIHVFCE